MTVYVVMTGVVDEMLLDSIWDSLQAAKGHVDAIIRTSPRPSLWKQCKDTTKLLWSGGGRFIDITEEEVQTGTWMQNAGD